METDKIDLEDKLAHDFDSIKSKIQELPENIAHVRKNAFSEFLQFKLPLKGHEDWKFTDLKKVINANYKHILEKPSFDYKVEDIFRCDVPNLETDTHITVNGWYSEEKEPIKIYQSGVIVGSFAAAIKQFPDLVSKYYTNISGNHCSGLVHLNTAFANDGIFIYIPKGITVETPIQVIDIVSGDEDVFVQRRNLIIAEEGALAHIVVCDHSLNFNKSFSNSVTEVVANPMSVVHLTRIQNSSNNSSKTTNVYVSQKEKSVVTLNTIILHGGFVRNNIHVSLEEPYAENNLNGIYLCDREQYVDNFTFVEHKASDCISNQKYKGVMDEKSHAVFSGKIHVKKDAQKTQAFQANNNLLLSDDAKVNSKPQLEIYADDVKCSHGATIGQLDEDALFYLRARGISFEESRMLLMQAFANEVIQKISVDALRVRIEDMVTKRLRGELSRCNHCVINCC